MTKEAQSAMERHAQTILALMIVALLGWAGMTLWTLPKEIVRLQEQVSALSSRLDVVTGLPDRVARLEVQVRQLEDRRQ